jgi:hypothetical protein
MKEIVFGVLLASIVLFGCVQQQAATPTPAAGTPTASEGEIPATSVDNLTSGVDSDLVDLNNLNETLIPGDIDSSYLN